MSCFHILFSGSQFLLNIIFWYITAFDISFMLSNIARGKINFFHFKGEKSQLGLTRGHPDFVYIL